MVDYSIVVNHYEYDKLMQLSVNVDRQMKSSVSMNFYEQRSHSQ